MKQIILIIFLLVSVNTFSQDIKIDSVRILSPKTFLKETTIKKEQNFLKEFEKISKKHKADILPAMYFYNNGMVYLTGIYKKNDKLLPTEQKEIL